MEIRQLIDRIVSRNTREYLSGPAAGLYPEPRLYPPATRRQIVELGQRAGHSIEASYKEFLSLTDGMDGLYATMPVYGCHDWESHGKAHAGLEFIEALRTDGTPVDVGLPEGIGLFPVSLDGDRASGIFQLEPHPEFSERFWWVGEGSSLFFRTFGDILKWVVTHAHIMPASI
ncbi:SMI1/KNR4 family protein [Streptomyces sp. NPDC058739]|uniref:SMI1/KNR4 family protein n=1 Tax=Streptomyces sp. NPDC058739 TaxID=3346618 RepID=UPI00369515B8